jgi:hypothetical protein
MHVELNDKERQNINNLDYQVASEYEGESIGIPILTGLENIRLMAGLKTECFNVKFNATHKIILFQYGDDVVNVEFFVPGLVK